MPAQRLGLALILAVVLIALYLIFTSDRVANSPEITPTPVSIAPAPQAGMLSQRLPY